MAEEISIEDAILELCQQGATDVHFQAGQPLSSRIGGKISYHGQRLSSKNLTEITNSLVEERHLKKFADSGNLDFSYNLPHSDIRFRGSLTFSTGIYSIALRVIPDEIPPLTELGLPFDLAQRLLFLNEGLILVCGPMNSGKSTTNASTLNAINLTRSDRIVTIEDPIEYRYPLAKSTIIQREVGSDVANFYEGLRAALRQDVNEIYVGEVRDTETAEMTLQAALTGHLVLATLHAKNSKGALDRFTNFFPSERQAAVQSQLASVLDYTLSQQLIPSEEDIRKRVLAMEVLNAQVDEVKSIIRRGKLEQLINPIQQGKKYGMISMDNRLKELYAEGLISKENLFRFAHDPQYL